MNEDQVREELDRMLGLRNWNVKNPAEVSVEFEMERRWGNVSGPATDLYPNREFADYLLYGRDRRPLALIEAKRTSKNPRAGQTQADGYANNIKAEYDFDPFIFLANGEDIWFWDRLRYPPRIVRGFFERDDLERLDYQRRSRRPLSAIQINPEIADRDYQAEAIKRVFNGLEEGYRTFLLVMATGTGKTRTAMALIDALIRARWINTVLFLADRKMLRDQAYGLRGFQGFFTEACGKVTSGRFDKNKRLYAATIQTMMECYRDISPGFFDLVISDECHRSIYNKWKDVLTYFDAIQVGLTATPSDWGDRDTFLSRFENNRFPLVAISVDMLDTGVDIREVVNLVFAKPIFSKIKFWQMIGRGTRTLEPTALKEWCREKRNFLVIDHWNNFEYFKMKPEGTFTQFIKMILGTFQFPTAEEQIAESFDAFIVRKNYFNADQTRFLRVVKSVFLEKARRHEALALTDLYEEPFDTFGVDAADRLFKKEELKEIITFFNQLQVP